MSSQEVRDIGGLAVVVVRNIYLHFKNLDPIRFADNWLKQRGQE